MTKEEFKREWGVDGMPHDKIRLVDAAWNAAFAEGRKSGMEEAARMVDKKVSQWERDELDDFAIRIAREIRAAAQDKP